MRTASTVAKNVSKPFAAPSTSPPADRKSKLPFGLARKPSRLVPTKTDVLMGARSAWRSLHRNPTIRLGRELPIRYHCPSASHCTAPRHDAKIVTPTPPAFGFQELPGFSRAPPGVARDALKRAP